MKQHRPILAFASLALAALACNPLASLVAADPTLTPLPPTETQAPTDVPAGEPTEAPTEEPTVASPTTNDASRDAYPGQIAYTRTSVTAVDIYRINPDGTGDEVIIASPAGPSYLPSWSPDNTRIIYRYDNLDVGTTELWLLDLGDGLDTRRLTDGSVAPAGVVSWSPDGAYVVFDDFGAGVWRLEIASGALMNLTADYDKWNIGATWSPAGDLIAFVTDRPAGTNDDIWVMNGDGSSKRVLTDNPNWEDVKPGWSPDGKEVAFFRWNILNSDAPGGPGGLWRINVETGEETLILADDLGLLIKEAPVWSPDGNYIAFAFVSSVWIMPVDGGEPVTIETEADEVRLVSWSPDSQAVTFTATQTDQGTAFVAARDGSGIWSLLEEAFMNDALYPQWSNLVADE